MWKIDPKQIQALACICIHIYILSYKYMQNMFPKVGLLAATKGGGKEENNNSE
jgi:hypothetical protein